MGRGKGREKPSPGLILQLIKLKDCNENPLNFNEIQ
jgi:hypothetical protein